MALRTRHLLKACCLPSAHPAKHQQDIYERLLCRLVIVPYASNRTTQRQQALYEYTQEGFRFQCVIKMDTLNDIHRPIRLSNASFFICSKRFSSAFRRLPTCTRPMVSFGDVNIPFFSMFSATCEAWI